MADTIEKNDIEDLINFKLRKIQELISSILDRWNETSSAEFIKKSKKGNYPESENDAIDLRQLLIEEEKLLNLLSRL